MINFWAHFWSPLDEVLFFVHVLKIVDDDTINRWTRTGIAFHLSLLVLFNKNASESILEWQHLDIFIPYRRD